MREATYERYSKIAQQIEQSGLSIPDFFSAHSEEIGLKSLLYFKKAMRDWRKENQRRTSPYTVVSSSQSQDNKIRVFELGFNEEEKSKDTVVTVTYDKVSFSVPVQGAYKFIANTIIELANQGFINEEL